MLLHMVSLKFTRESTGLKTTYLVRNTVNVKIAELGLLTRDINEPSQESLQILCKQTLFLVLSASEPEHARSPSKKLSHF
jgi:hypothetical protein